MPISVIEWIATIFAILGIIKIAVVLNNRKFWYNKVTRPIYSGGGTTSFIFIILAILVFWFLIQEISIVHIFVAVAFTALLIGAMFALYNKELLSFADKIIKKKFSGIAWIYILIWLTLSLWVLYEVFLV